jgi:hypothetical protein
MLLLLLLLLLLLRLMEVVEVMIPTAVMIHTFFCSISIFQFICS